MSLKVCGQPAPPPPPPVPDSWNLWTLTAPPWKTIFDDPARSYTNLNLAPSWDYEGTGLSVATNEPAWLQLYVYQDGWTNITLDSGSLEIWVSANWTSMADSGTGPGAWATVWDIGSYRRDASIGAWLLAVDPSGSNLVWVAQSGGSNQMLWTPIDFDAGDWHQIVATWSSTNSSLYVDGTLAATNGPILYEPSDTICSNDGFCVGSLSASGTNAGTNQFQGQLQWLVTYDYPLSTNDVSAEFGSVASFIGYFGYNAPGNGISGGGGGHPDYGPLLPDDGGGGGGGGIPAGITFNPGTNLYLLIAQQTSNTAVITFSNAVAGLPYVLLQSTDLQNWTTNQSFLATNILSIAPQPVSFDAATNLYFMGVQEVVGAVRWSNSYGASGDALGSGWSSSPAIGPDGTIYIASGGYLGGSMTNNMLFAINPLTGNVLWSNSLYNNSEDLSLQAQEITCSPTVTASNVYIGSDDDNLYSFTFSGATNWYGSMGFETAVYATSALSSNGDIYVATDETSDIFSDRPTVSGLLSINPNGPSTNWIFVPQDQDDTGDSNNGGDVDSSPAVAADGTIYFLAEGQRLYAVSPAGHLKWFLPMPGDGQADSFEPSSSPAIAPDGTIYVGSDSSYFYAVNPDGSLKSIWDADPGNIGDIVFQGPPSIAPDGTVYAPVFSYDGDDDLFSFNPDGTTNWEFFNLGGGTMSAPAIGSNGTVYTGTFDYNLYAVSNNNVVWSFHTGGWIVSSPVILSDGTIVFGSEDGFIYALWGSTPPATNAPWPMFHHDPYHTGLQTPAVAATDTTAPFVYDATNIGTTNFSFSIVGVTNTSWNVYASTNLSNWVQIYTNFALTNNVIDTFNANAVFTDPDIAGLSQRFYMLSNSGAASRIIGFVTQTLAPGTNLIADQLCQVDDGIMFHSSFATPMNTINDLFVPYWNAEQSGTAVMRWNGQSFDVFTFNFNVHNGPGWYDTNEEINGDTTLLPGTSVLMTNGTPMTNTFIGLLRQQQIIQVQPGTNYLSTNYLSATFPVAGEITNITGYVGQSGDVIKLWDTNAQIFHAYTNTGSGWSPSSPAVGVGEGFVLITSNSYTWTNTWSQ